MMSCKPLRIHDMEENDNPLILIDVDGVLNRMPARKIPSLTDGWMQRTAVLELGSFLHTSPSILSTGSGCLRLPERPGRSLPGAVPGNSMPICMSGRISGCRNFPGLPAAGSCGLMTSRIWRTGAPGTRYSGTRSFRWMSSPG